MAHPDNDMHAHSGATREPLRALTSNIPDLWDVHQTARALSVSTTTVRRMVADGRLKAYRYGPRLIRIDPADVRALLRPVTMAA